MQRARAFARLLRWLGPWAAPDAAPSGVVRRELLWPRGEGQAPLRAFVFAPAAGKPIGALLVAHGLHPKGPEDPRFDRFLRILAHAGFLIAAPALPDYMQLRCDPNVARDFARAFDALRASPECPVATPGVLSISFGSYPALCLLCDPERAAHVSGAIIFGGYGDPVSTLRYTLGVRQEGSPPPDPLSMPAIAMNLAPELAIDAAQREQASEAWLQLARATWGFPELKEPAAHAPIAERLAGPLQAPARELFLRGAGLTQDAREYFLRALADPVRLRSIDPRPQLAALQRPVHFMHGREDDVIPCSELQTLTAACPDGAPVTSYLTGLYAHTGAAGIGALPTLLREGTLLLRMIKAVVEVATATGSAQAK